MARRQTEMEATPDSPKPEKKSRENRYWVARMVDIPSGSDGEPVGIYPTVEGVFMAATLKEADRWLVTRGNERDKYVVVRLLRGPCAVQVIPSERRVVKPAS